MPTRGQCDHECHERPQPTAPATPPCAAERFHAWLEDWAIRRYPNTFEAIVEEVLAGDNPHVALSEVRALLITIDTQARRAKEAEEALREIKDHATGYDSPAGGPNIPGNEVEDCGECTDMTEIAARALAQGGTDGE